MTAAQTEDGRDPFNPILPPRPKEHTIKPLSRYVTFLMGIASTCLIYLIVLGLLKIKWDYTWIGKLVIFVIVFVLWFLAGLNTVAGEYPEPETKDPMSKDKKEPKVASKGDDEGETKYWGVVKLFDAPLPKAWQWILLPTGTSWLPPIFFEVVPIAMFEQAWQIPRPGSKEEGFDIESISYVDIDTGKSVAAKDRAEGGNYGTKYVPMLAAVRIRWQVLDPYLWYEQDAPTIEKTFVTLVVQTLRYIATNGNYPGNRSMPIISDFALMQSKHQLGEYLSEDLQQISEPEWGIDPIQVIVRRLRPKSEDLLKRYIQVAQEMADLEAQTIEVSSVRRNAKGYMDDGAAPQEAHLYALLSAKKTTLENFKNMGGGPSLFVNTDKGGNKQPSQSNNDDD